MSTSSKPGEDMESKKDKVKLKRILVPIDGSTYSMRAAKYAIEVAKLQKAQIFCIHIISKIPYGYAFAGSAVELYFEDINDQAKSWFNQIIEMAKSCDIDTDYIKTDVFRDVESIVDAIINYASHNSMDLIIMGTKGRTGIARFLLGSVANGVVQHAHCPVLLVR